MRHYSGQGCTLKSRIPHTENLQALPPAAATHLSHGPERRQGPRGRKGPLTVSSWRNPVTMRALLSRLSALGLHSEPSARRESASLMESSLSYKLRHTLPSASWFLDICFSNSFSAALMPVRAPSSSAPSRVPLPPASLVTVTSADTPQWGRQSSGPVPYLRTQTPGHRKCWSPSTILRAKHSKFPNLLIEKQYAKLLSPSLSSSSPAQKATPAKPLHQVAGGPSQKAGAGCASSGSPRITQRS